MIRSGVSRVRESSDRLGRRLAASPVFSAETYARIVNPAPAELDSALPRRSQSEAPRPGEPSSAPSSKRITDAARVKNDS
jgi:hypothetical protein